MRKKTKMANICRSLRTKIFFSPVLKSPTHIGFTDVKKNGSKISHLGTFKGPEVDSKESIPGLHKRLQIRARRVPLEFPIFLNSYQYQFKQMLLSSLILKFRVLWNESIAD